MTTYFLVDNYFFLKLKFPAKAQAFNNFESEVQQCSTAKQRTVEQETYQSYQISISTESWMALDALKIWYLNFDFSYGNNDYLAILHNKLLIMNRYNSKLLITNKSNPIE